MQDIVTNTNGFLPSAEDQAFIAKDTVGWSYISPFGPGINQYRINHVAQVAPYLLQLLVCGSSLAITSTNPFGT